MGSIITITDKEQISYVFEVEKAKKRSKRILEKQQRLEEKYNKCKTARDKRRWQVKWDALYKEHLENKAKCEELTKRYDDFKWG
jgi:hypothetical protein